MWDLLEAIIESLNVYQKHGIKGCLWVIGALVLLFGGIFVFVYVLK